MGLLKNIKKNPNLMPKKKSKTKIVELEDILPKEELAKNYVEKKKETRK